MAAFEFGPFLLDSAKRSLLREGVPQSLPPKAFDVLALLVQCRERVVSKEELLSTLWAETFVEDGNLSQQIFVLRRTLNGLSESPEYIATIPRRGYRFTAQVIERSGSERLAESAPNEPTQRKPRWLVPSLGAVVVLVAALLAVFWRQFAADPEPRILVVTAYPGLERFPSISPDGNFVVFSWTGSNPDGSSDLWVKAVEGDGLRRLTETPAAEFQSAWSPDGREIAFVRAGQGVFIVSALGGQERRISGSGSMVGWTPDSRSLLVRDRTDEGPHGIFRIELATGTRHQVTRAPRGMGDWVFEVSPDGSTVAFVRYGMPGISDVYVAPIAGGEPRRRTNWNANISGVSWASNGREILYSVAEAPGLDHSLFRIPADGDRIERGTRALHTNVASLSMSRPRSGQPGRIAFTRSRIDVGLRLVDLEGQRVGDVFQSIGHFSDSTRVDVPGRFSRDGKQVAFLSDRTGWAEVWIANADGSGLRQATTLHATELLIGSWSPDSRRMVIDAAIAGDSDVFLVSLDGGSPVRVTTEPGIRRRLRNGRPTGAGSISPQTAPAGPKSGKFPQRAVNRAVLRARAVCSRDKRQMVERFSIWTALPPALVASAEPAGSCRCPSQVGRKRSFWIESDSVSGR